MEFKEFKKEIVSRAESSNACKSQLEKAINAENFKELIKVITDNFYYSCNYRIIDIELLNKVGQETCNKYNLYFNIDCKNGYLLAENCDVVIINSTATLWGNSKATLRGNSKATLWENSTATLLENSTATLWGNSYAISYNEISHKLNDFSILRYYYKNEIVISQNQKIKKYSNG